MNIGHENEVLNFAECVFGARQLEVREDRKKKTNVPTSSHWPTKFLTTV